MRWGGVTLVNVRRRPDVCSNQIWAFQLKPFSCYDSSNIADAGCKTGVDEGVGHESEPLLRLLRGAECVADVWESSPLVIPRSCCRNGRFLQEAVVSDAVWRTTMLSSLWRPETFVGDWMESWGCLGVCLMSLESLEAVDGLQQLVEVVLKEVMSTGRLLDGGPSLAAQEAAAESWERGCSASWWLLTLQWLVDAPEFADMREWTGSKWLAMIRVDIEFKGCQKELEYDSVVIVVVCCCHSFGSPCWKGWCMGTEPPFCPISKGPDESGVRPWQLAIASQVSALQWSLGASWRGTRRCGPQVYSLGLNSPLVFNPGGSEGWIFSLVGLTNM